ncbi:hypothetical protein HN51_044528 [Arachis hypogaea]
MTSSSCSSSMSSLEFNRTIQTESLSTALGGGILYCKKETSSIEKSQPTALKEKRFRKPTLRYIEETSNSRSKEKVPTVGTKRKHSSASSCDELHIRIKALRKIRVEKSSNGISDVTIPKLKACRGRPKKEKLDDEEAFSLDSEDKCLTPKRSKKKDRRKHQRMWTLFEVIKLADGIYEYGVGRWTNKKRFSFSSSSYRTPIDLRVFHKALSISIVSFFANLEFLVI